MTVAVVAGLVVAGVGFASRGDEESFRDRYREITLDYQSRIERTKSTRERAKQPDDQFARRTYSEVLAATTDAFEEYSDLDAPDRDSARWRQFLNALRAQLGPMEDAVRAADAGRPEEVGAALRRYGTALAEWIALRQVFDDVAGIEAPTSSPAASVSAPAA